LWDNIRFLSDSDMDAQDEEASPHVFLLSGWGAPGSAAPDDMDASGGRRPWTCWCAIHRPSDPLGNGDSGIIIMEFELELDRTNPLYTVPAEEVAAGAETPGDYVNSPPSTEKGDGKSSTVDSDQTLLDASPALLTPDATPKDEDSAFSVRLAVSDMMPKEAVKDEPPWTLNAEDILESTTSRAKPLLALERLRSTARGEPQSQSQSVGTTDATQARPRESRRAGGGIGMMDVLAIMAQINEQLGDVPDLAAFYQVVVGVIKDLSQFHRVLVYQFDEAWNGKVVAELLDWSKTHELYRGLHFPAADIPAQVRIEALNSNKWLNFLFGPL
jgi:hypothetical protein